MKLFQALCFGFLYFICYFGDALAVRRFCKGYMKISSAGEKMFLFFFPFGMLAVEVAYAVHPVSYLLYVIMRYLVFSVLVFVLFQAEFEKKIFLLSLLAAVRRLLWDFCSSFLSGIILCLHHIVKKETEPVIQLWWEDCIIIFLTYAAGVLAIEWLAAHKMSFLGMFPGKWPVAFAVPFFLFIAVADIAGLAATRGILFRSGGDWGLFYDQIFSHAGFCVLAALSLLATGFYLVGMDRIYLEQKKKERYHAGIVAYQAMEEQYRQMERLRHDMKNHLMGMQGMVKKREWDKLEQYLSRMSEAGAMAADEEATGNKALDALFYYKRKLAEEKNIAWECNVQLPGVHCVDSFDLCVLFGNMLDNAIEACERMRCDKMRFISVKSKLVKKCFLLEVKNSTDLEKVEEVRYTHKENPEMHGIGIQNVEDVVQHYHGILGMEIKDGIFSVSVLLPLVT